MQLKTGFIIVINFSWSLAVHWSMPWDSGFHHSRETCHYYHCIAAFRIRSSPIITQVAQHTCIICNLTFIFTWFSVQYFYWKIINLQLHLRFQIEISFFFQNGWKRSTYRLFWTLGILKIISWPPEFQLIWRGASKLFLHYKATVGINIAMDRRTYRD